MVKQVPDTKAVTAKAMKDDGTVNRAALPAIFNPEDLHALETALEVKGKHGGTVTVICMGPPTACDILRESLCRGADRAILITDRRAAASDTLATSYILSCAVRKLPRFDLVFCGRQAIDGDTAQVGPQLAEKLAIPQVTYLEELREMTNKHVVVKRNLGNGWELVRCSLPALITVIDTANVPRPSSAKLIMKHKKARSVGEITKEIVGENDPNDAKFKPMIDAKVKELNSRGLLIEQWNLDDIKADLVWCGRDGSPTKVHRIQAVVLKGSGHKAITPNEEGINTLIHELIEDRTLG
jgi:electron transfer flavoprotein beta subunit